MNDQIERTEWCERVRAAIVAGNILEDPGYWRPHVEACATCRPRVEGLLTLRRLMERAKDEAPIPDVAPAEGARVMRGVFERFHRHRRRQRIAGAFVVLLAAGVGAFALTRPRSGTESERDPVAYARKLDRQVFPRGAPANLTLLKGDPELRAEYVRALDDPSSLVRRTALAALVMSSVEVSRERLESIIREWNETLDTPVELASSSDGGASIREALARRRTATLREAILGAYVQAARNEPRVSSATLIGLLHDRDAEVRRLSLMALASDPTFVPGDEVRAVLSHDPDADARRNAATCLITRGGPKGASTVIAHLRAKKDYPIEALILADLGRGEEALAFHRERIASAETPARLALLHATYLVRAGDRTVPTALVDRALAGSREDLEQLASTASEADWTELRAPLQAAWLAQPPATRHTLGDPLARWDVRTTDPMRLQMALAICEAQRDARLRKVVIALSRSEVPAIRDRAAALLNEWPTK